MKLRMVVLLGALMALTGCFRTYYAAGQGGMPGTGKGYWHSIWAFGLVEGEPVNIEKECPGGNFKGYYVFKSFGAGLIGALQPVYTPMNVNIECVGGSRSASAATPPQRGTKSAPNQGSTTKKRSKT